MDVQTRQSGQGLVEYALIFGLIAIVAVIALFYVGGGVGGVFSEINEQVAAAGATHLPGLLFSDSFDASGNWLEVQGKWELVDAEYRIVGGGEHRAFAVAGDSSWTDYSVELAASLLKGDGYGVYFRASNPEAVSGYVFQYDPGYNKSQGGEFIIRKVVDGKESAPIARAKAPEGYDWYEENRTITVEARGSTLVASIDGTPVLQVEDSTFSSGTIGVRTWDSTVATFDDVRVTPLS